jgi:quinol monooxygenase YgiN
MSDPIVSVDSSEIREGKLEDVLSAIQRLVAFVEANEAEAIAYSIYVDKENRRMTVVQIHPSSAAMEFHMAVAAPVFREFADLLTLLRVDFYGRPSEALLEQMRRKAQLLGGAPVFVNELHAGFTRFAART